VTSLPPKNKPVPPRLGASDVAFLERLRAVFGCVPASLEVLDRPAVRGADLDPERHTPPRPGGEPTLGLTARLRHVVQLPISESQQCQDPVALISAPGWPGWFPVRDGDPVVVVGRGTGRKRRASGGGGQLFSPPEDADGHG
jgi:hypothetical protein